MGIYIPGMEMPKSCGKCKAFVCYRQWAGDTGDCFCGITKNDAEADGKNADCPLIPVPDHGRLIDADALCDKLEKAGKIKPYLEGALNVAISFALTSPTIIPATNKE